MKRNVIKSFATRAAIAAAALSMGMGTAVLSGCGKKGTDVPAGEQSADATSTEQVQEPGVETMIDPNGVSYTVRPLDDEDGADNGDNGGSGVKKDKGDDGDKEAAGIKDEKAGPAGNVTETGPYVQFLPEQVDETYYPEEDSGNGPALDGVEAASPASMDAGSLIAQALSDGAVTSGIASYAGKVEALAKIAGIGEITSVSIAEGHGMDVSEGSTVLEVSDAEGHAYYVAVTKDGEAEAIVDKGTGETVLDGREAAGR